MIGGSGDNVGNMDRPLVLGIIDASRPRLHQTGFEPGLITLLRNVLECPQGLYSLYIALGGSAKTLSKLCPCIFPILFLMWLCGASFYRSLTSDLIDENILP